MKGLLSINYGWHLDSEYQHDYQLSTWISIIKYIINIIINMIIAYIKVMKAYLTLIKVGILTVNSEYASTAAYNHNWNILPHEKLKYLAVWRKNWNILHYGGYVVIFSGLHWFLMFLPDTDGNIQWSTNPPKEFWHNCLFGEIRSK